MPRKIVRHAALDQAGSELAAIGAVSSVEAGGIKVNEDDLRNQLRRLGLRVRTRKVETAPSGPKPGHIAFDDRGNAVYEWSDERFAEDGDSGERARRRALAHPGLAVVEDEPSPNDPIRNNVKGLRLGYNPYESGLLKKQEWKSKRDLRELSKWIEKKKSAGRNSDGEEV